MDAILGSWKEIANYLSKGVRTVQRWERQNGLPVHRPSGSSKGVVLAFTGELDQWAHGNKHSLQSNNRVHVRRNSELSSRLLKQSHQLQDNARQLMALCQQFIERSQRQQPGVHRELDLLHSSRKFG